MTESKLKAAQRLAAAEEFALNNGEKHSTAGNGACYIDNGWPSMYGFVNRGLSRLIERADDKQLKRLQGMVKRQLKGIEARIKEQ